MANFDRKEHLQHHAVSLRQHGFLVLVIVDVLASTEAFVGTVCLIAVHRSVSGRTGCFRCGKVGKTPVSVY